jgi:hypothetical protein
MRNVLNISFDNDTPEVFVRLAALPTTVQHQVMTHIGPPEQGDFGGTLRRDLPPIGVTWRAGGSGVPCIASLKNRVLLLRTPDGDFEKQVVGVLLRETTATFMTLDADRVVLLFEDRPAGLPHGWIDLLPQDVTCRILEPFVKEEEIYDC